MPRMTQAELNAYEARRAAARRDGIKTAFPGLQSEDESELQQQIAEQCARRGWIALRGSMAHRTRRVAGEQDFTIMADGGRTIYVEVKTRTGKLSTEQRGLHAWARKLGHEIHVVRSLEEFCKVCAQVYE